MFYKYRYKNELFTSILYTTQISKQFELSAPPKHFFANYLSQSNQVKISGMAYHSLLEQIHKRDRIFDNAPYLRKNWCWYEFDVLIHLQWKTNWSLWTVVARFFTAFVELKDASCWYTVFGDESSVRIQFWKISSC